MYTSIIIGKSVVVDFLINSDLILSPTTNSQRKQQFVCSRFQGRSVVGWQSIEASGIAGPLLKVESVTVCYSIAGRFVGWPAWMDGWMRRSPAAADTATGIAWTQKNNPFCGVCLN